MKLNFWRRVPPSLFYRCQLNLMILVNLSQLNEEGLHQAPDCMFGRAVGRLYTIEFYTFYFFYFFTFLFWLWLNTTAASLLYLGCTRGMHAIVP